MKIAYDGTVFSGSQRQPRQRTVESELRAGLALVGAVSEDRPALFQIASRTDSGVSAAGNVIAFDTDFDPAMLTRALLANVQDVWPWATVVVPDEFDARRHATTRAYRYRVPRALVDARALDVALARFEGSHDFSAFARVQPHREPRRPLHVARVEGFDGPFTTLRFEAPGFLWNQVRRIVSAAISLARGVVSADTIDRALATGVGPDLGLALPEPLLLLDVDYEGVTFVRDERSSRRMVEDLEARHLDAARVVSRISDFVTAPAAR